MWSINPDLTTLGKFIGGGLPVGCVGGREDILRILDTKSPYYVAHSGTLNNNRFAMAATKAMLSEVLTEPALGALFLRGTRLRAAINERLVGHGLQATGMGSLLTIHPTLVPIRNASDTADLDKAVIVQLYCELLDRGVLIGKSGFVSLSLVQDEVGDADFLDRLEESVPAALAVADSSHTPCRRSVSAMVIRLSVESGFPARVSLSGGGLGPRARHANARRVRRCVHGLVQSHKAVLFRGFDVVTVDEFDVAARSLIGNLQRYRACDAPRHAERGLVYNASGPKATKVVRAHNELSYAPWHPSQIVFGCSAPASAGARHSLRGKRRLRVDSGHYP